MSEIDWEVGADGIAWPGLVPSGSIVRKVGLPAVIVDVSRDTLFTGAVDGGITATDANTMEVPVLFELKTLSAEARTISAALTTFADRIDKVRAELEPKDTQPVSPSDFKRYDGRLNDEGIRLMESAFEAGRRVTDIAREFEITVSAASHRKRIWEAKRDFSD